MIFQYTFTSGSSSSLISALQQYGFVDLLIPFTLIFSVLYAILMKIGLFSGDEGKRYNTVISLAIALLIVIPHVLSPSPNDAINVINRFLPEFVFVTIALLILLMLVGLVGGGTQVASGPLVGVAAFIAVIYLGLVIINALSPTSLPFLFLSDPSFQALVIVLLVLGLVIWYINKPTTSTFKLSDWIKELFGGP